MKIPIKLIVAAFDTMLNPDNIVRYKLMAPIFLSLYDYVNSATNELNKLMKKIKDHESDNENMINTLDIINHLTDKYNKNRNVKLLQQDINHYSGIVKSTFAWKLYDDYISYTSDNQVLRNDFRDIYWDIMAREIIEWYPVNAITLQIDINIGGKDNIIIDNIPSMLMIGIEHYLSMFRDDALTIMNDGNINTIQFYGEYVYTAGYDGHDMKLIHSNMFNYNISIRDFYISNGTQGKVVTVLTDTSNSILETTTNFITQLTGRSDTSDIVFMTQTIPVIRIEFDEFNLILKGLQQTSLYEYRYIDKIILNRDYQNNPVEIRQVYNILIPTYETPKKHTKIKSKIFHDMNDSYAYNRMVKLIIGYQETWQQYAKANPEREQDINGIYEQLSDISVTNESIVTHPAYLFQNHYNLLSPKFYMTKPGFEHIIDLKENKTFLKEDKE